MKGFGQGCRRAPQTPSRKQLRVVGKAVSGMRSARYKTVGMPLVAGRSEWDGTNCRFEGGMELGWCDMLVEEDHGTARDGFGEGDIWEAGSQGVHPQQPLRPLLVTFRPLLATPNRSRLCDFWFELGGRSQCSGWSRAACFPDMPLPVSCSWSSCAPA